MEKIISWNVNGIRACIKKGFFDWLEKEDPDILGIQETKATKEQVRKLLAPYEDRYHIYWNAAEKAGYSGTALFTKNRPLNVVSKEHGGILGKEGRVITAEYPGFTLMNIYYPNGQKDQERLDYKMKFYDEFLNEADRRVQNGENLIVMGDLNTAHREIDLARPKDNEKVSGFLPMEREWIDLFLSHGYTDTFRNSHPEPERYSWWSYRTRARDRNVGWRLDYVFVNNALTESVNDAFILDQVQGSDHCPVGIQFETPDQQHTSAV